MTELPRGKRPFQASDRDFKLSTFVDTERLDAKVPVSFGHELGIKNWLMLGNDRFGCCTCAGACHEHRVWDSEGGHDVPFTEKNALELYSAVTGFRADDPSTDQGAVVRDVLGYRRKKGVRDAQGKWHKIDAFLLLDRSDLIRQIDYAAYAFGAVGIGFAFPSYAMTQFNENKVWRPIPGVEPHPNEGHYVPVVGKRNGMLDTVTWGRRQKMTIGFAEEYVDEAWAIYSKSMLNAQGKTPEGLDDKALRAALASLG